MQGKYKVALISICLNEPYWQYIEPMFASASKFFLKGHEVDYIVWSDMPQDRNVGAKIIPTETHAWPLPTLNRYTLFLREEKLLEEYDFVFYCDADMLFVSPVGNEVLGDNLTVAEHPMYALKQGYVPPYEPNPESKAYIPRLGKIITKNGKKRLKPIYAAGGFQGGRTPEWIEAMKTMKEWIDEDFMKGYIPIWNDESIWNAFLFRMTPTGLLPDSTVVLDPSYICPDSLNKAYYQKAWGRNYVPKLVTLTKPFSLSKEGGQALNQLLK